VSTRLPDDAGLTALPEPRVPSRVPSHQLSHQLSHELPERLLLALLIALLALLVAPMMYACGAEAQQMAPAPAPATGAGGGWSAPLRPGDGVRLAFWRDAAASGLFLVDETGKLSLPYLGDRAATGIAADELKRRLTREYEEYLANQAIQIVLLRRVTVLGSVRSPGMYHVDPTMELHDVLALAGGPTPDGRPTRIQVRRGAETIRYDLRGGAAGAVELRSGDQILVPERGWLWRNGAVLAGAAASFLGVLVAQAVF
jgi:polysaccharide export outer membrane protein